MISLCAERVEIEAGRSMTAKKPPCVHHWMLGETKNHKGEADAKCVKCNKKRTFDGGVKDYGVSAWRALIRES